MGQDRLTQNARGNGGNQFGQYAGQVAQNQQGFNAWQNGGIQGVQNAGVQSGGNQNGLVVVLGIANQSRTGNVVVARAEGTRNWNQARCYNCRGLGHIARNLTARPKRRDAAYLQTQLLIGDLDEIEEVNTNCTLMVNLQHASTFGTQHNRAPVYDTDGSAENDNHVTSVAPSMVQSGGTVETSSSPNEEIRAHQETVYRNLVDQVARVHRVNSNMRANNVKLKSELARYKIQEQRVKISQEKYDKPKKCYQKHFLDKEVDLEARIKDLENILIKRDQTVQTMHMLNPKPDSIYHPNQKMALGYPNPSYLKKSQQKQQSLYNANLLLKEHDPPAVYDLEETLELAQESRDKMRLLKKEIKPTNYAKINHLLGVFVPQMTKSMKELFLSNVSNMVTASKMIYIPNEDLSDDTTSSVARKFLNEVKSSLVTLQRVDKQKMTLEVHNWSSFAHKEEADESRDKQKSLELKIEQLLKASVSHDIMSIMQNSLVDVPSNLQTEVDRTKEKLKLCIIKKEKEYAVLWNNWYTKCEECKYDKISYDKAYNDMQQKVERLQAQLRYLKGKSSNTPSVSNTLDPLNQKLESKIIELEFQVVNYERKISHLKTTYKNLFDSIKSNRAHAKLHDLIFENAKLRAQLFENTSESVKNISGTSVTPHVDKPKLSAVTPLSKKLHVSMPSHFVPQPREFNVVKHRNYSEPENPNELFQKLLKDLKELAEYDNSPSKDRPIFLNDNKDHNVQNEESFENYSNEIIVSNSNEEKEEPPQDSDIRKLIREECYVKVCEEQKQSMEDTMLELVKICHQKELLYIHDNVDDLIEGALNSKLLMINSNSQRLKKEQHEVKNVVEQPAERGNHKIMKSGIEELVPILSENEVTLEDKRECDVPISENSPICDDHSEIFSDSNNDDDILIYDDFEDVEYVEASLFDPEIFSIEEENVVHQEEQEVDLEDISQIQDVYLREKLLSITCLISNIKSLKDNPTLDHVLNSSVSILNFKESDNSLLDNFSPEFETFCDHTEETRSGNTTHADDSLPEYDSFSFEIEPDQERLINVVKSNVSDDSSNDPL
nr:hypothetical protein [Tanacetum cinerariifolium]